MNKSILYGIILFLIPVFLGAQENPDDYIIVSYQNIIQMAQDQSPASLRTKTKKENSYWAYKSFSANYKPSIFLDASLPGYIQSNELITQNDGSKQSRSIHQTNSSAGLTAQQLIGKTGSRISFHSQLNSSYNFLDTTQYYTSTPFEIEFVQPIFQYNEHKWNQEIESLKFQESEKSFFYEMEQISINATYMFFDLMIAQIQKDIAELNLKNNDTIYKIARGRFELGRIAENEYLQIELQYLKSQQELEQALMDMQNNSLALKNYLGIKDEKDLLLILPDLAHNIIINNDLALEKAKINRPEMLQYDRQLLEAQARLRRAESNSGLSADLRVSYGLSSSSQTIQNTYDEFGNRSVVNLSLVVPIVDWGRAKASKSQARANLNLVEYNVEQELVNFEQEVITHINYYTQIRKQVDLAKKSDEIAKKRYDIAKNRYMIGNISITDINIASQEQDQAKKNYISSLKDYWIAYYTLRKLTMYDFLLNKDIFLLYEASY